MFCFCVFLLLISPIAVRKMIVSLGQEDQQMNLDIPALFQLAFLPQQVYNLQQDRCQVQLHQGVKSVEFAIFIDKS